MIRLHEIFELRVHRAVPGHHHPEFKGGRGLRRDLYAVPERRIERASYVPIGRTLHLVDIENLMGGPLGGDLALKAASSAYRAAAAIEGGDHVVVATNPGLWLGAKREWPGGQVLARGGPNGADIALIESAQNVDWIAARYDRIMIGSGDGVFAEIALAYKEVGMTVGVVSRERSLALVLGEAAAFVRLLAEPDLVRAVL